MTNALLLMRLFTQWKPTLMLMYAKPFYQTLHCLERLYDMCWVGVKHIQIPMYLTLYQGATSQPYKCS